MADDDRLVGVGLPCRFRSRHVWYVRYFPRSSILRLSQALDSDFSLPAIPVRLFHTTADKSFGPIDSSGMSSVVVTTSLTEGRGLACERTCSGGTLRDLLPPPLVSLVAVCPVKSSASAATTDPGDRGAAGD